MTERGAEYWRRIANDRLRALWIIAHANGGSYGIRKGAQEDYPGDDIAEVRTHTDPQFGDFIIQARRRRHADGETVMPGGKDGRDG
jgi:hypothetical protein